jgi:hypothetical protein
VRAPEAAPGEPVGRHGAVQMVFERRGCATVLTRCRSRVPLQVLVPVALEDPAAVVFIMDYPSLEACAGQLWARARVLLFGASPLGLRRG